MAVKFSVYDPILFILFRLIKINKMLQLYILSIYVHATIRKGHKMRGRADTNTNQIKNNRFKWLTGALFCLRFCCLIF